jgi:hypothetical protein
MIYNKFEDFVNRMEKTNDLIGNAIFYDFKVEAIKYKEDGDTNLRLTVVLTAANRTERFVHAEILGYVPLKIEAEATKAVEETKEKYIAEKLRAVVKNIVKINGVIE